MSNDPEWRMNNRKHQQRCAVTVMVSLAWGETNRKKIIKREGGGAGGGGRWRGVRTRQRETRMFVRGFPSPSLLSQKSESAETTKESGGSSSSSRPPRPPLGEPLHHFTVALLFLAASQ